MRHLAVLPAVERKDRARTQIAQSRVHPQGNAAVVGRCPTSGVGIPRPLQQRPLNSATGDCITPKDILAGRHQEIHAERHRKLEAARKQRQICRQQAA
jgi:hypothetical protein